MAFLAPVAASAADGSVTDLSPVEAWKADRTIILEAEDIDLDDFMWLARAVIVFADTDADPAYDRQLTLLQERIDELAERDVVLITDTTRSEPSALRKKLRPRGFMLTVIGKDGGVKLRKPVPWSVRELSRSIDKIPLRKQEIRERREQAE
ncbi:MAG: DUF4174 domain-containing protein [Boseongicola sp.]|nr:MAG: DUF4174 domain-containing protein [Boseongicola sp.]